jgi:hypothetical protein
MNKKFVELLSKTDLSEIDFYRRREKFLET